MGKQAAKKGGQNSGSGGKGGAYKSNKTADAAALGLGGSPSTPLADTSLLQPMANPSATAGLDPNMMSVRERFAHSRAPRLKALFSFNTRVIAHGRSGEERF